MEPTTMEISFNTAITVVTILIIGSIWLTIGSLIAVIFNIEYESDLELILWPATVAVGFINKATSWLNKRETPMATRK